MSDYNETTPAESQPDTNSQTNEQSTETLLRNLDAPAETSQTPEVETETETSATESPKSKSTGLSEDDITRILSKAMPSVQQAPTTEPARQYTPEEVKKLLNVFEPDDAFMERLSNPASAKEAVQEMLAGQAKHFNTVLQLERQAMLDEVNRDYSPVKQQLQQQAAAKAEVEFYSEFKDLKGREELTTTVMQALHARGAFQGQSATKIKQLIAGETRTILKKMGVSAGTSQSNGTQTTTSQRPAPATLSNGSQGGAGRGGSPAATGTSAVLQHLGL